MKLLALIFILVTIGLSLFFFEEIEYYFSFGPKQKLIGDLRRDQEQEEQTLINRYFQDYFIRKHKRDYPFGCRHRFYGRDQQNAYIYLICGEVIKDESHPNGQKIKFGFGIPTRVRFDSNQKIIKFSQARDGTDYATSTEWIFPQIIRRISKRIKD